MPRRTSRWCPHRIMHKASNCARSRGHQGYSQWCMISAFVAKSGFAHWISDFVANRFPYIFHSLFTIEWPTGLHKMLISYITPFSFMSYICFHRLLLIASKTGPQTEKRTDSITGLCTESLAELYTELLVELPAKLHAERSTESLTFSLALSPIHFPNTIALFCYWSIHGQARRSPHVVDFFRFHASRLKNWAVH